MRCLDILFKGKYDLKREHLGESDGPRDMAFHTIDEYVSRPASKSVVLWTGCSASAAHRNNYLFATLWSDGRCRCGPRYWSKVRKTFSCIVKPKFIRRIASYVAAPNHTAFCTRTTVKRGIAVWTCYGGALAGSAHRSSTRSVSPSPRRAAAPCKCSTTFGWQPSTS